MRLVIFVTYCAVLSLPLHEDHLKAHVGVSVLLPCMIVYVNHDVHVQVLEEFYNIFGPELKSVIGDPKKIEDVVKRVDHLVKPIEEIAFDAFSIKHMAS